MPKKSTTTPCIQRYKKKNGSFSYYVSIRRKHAKPIQKCCKTQTEAKHWLRSMQTKIIETRSFKELKSWKYTLSELIDRYEDSCFASFGQKDFGSICHLKWWRGNFGAKLLQDITPSLIASAKERLRQEKTRTKTFRSPACANRYLSSLSKVFTVATKEWELLLVNPFSKVSMFPENRGRIRFLSKAELQALLPECKSNENHNLYPVVYLAASLGMRFGEIANLLWKNIDFDKRLIILEVTKNKDMRILPMSEQLYSYLLEMSRGKSLEKRIFVYKSKIAFYTAIRRSFKQVLTTLHLTDVVFHTLRHTAASHFAMNGASQGELMEILGHRSIQTSKRYTHFNKQHLSKIIQKTNSNLSL